MSPFFLVSMSFFGLAGDHFAQLSQADVVTYHIKQSDQERRSEGDQVINDRDAGGQIWVEAKKFHSPGRRRMESAGRTAGSRNNRTYQAEPKNENNVTDRKIDSECEKRQPGCHHDQSPDAGGEKNRRGEG